MVVAGMTLGGTLALWSRRVAASLIQDLPLASAVPMVLGAGAAGRRCRSDHRSSLRVIGNDRLSYAHQFCTVSVVVAAVDTPPTVATTA